MNKNTVTQLWLWQKIIIYWIPFLGNPSSGSQLRHGWIQGLNSVFRTCSWPCFSPFNFILKQVFKDGDMQLQASVISAPRLPWKDSCFPKGSSQNPRVKSHWLYDGSHMTIPNQSLQQHQGWDVLIVGAALGAHTCYRKWKVTRRRSPSHTQDVITRRRMMMGPQDSRLDLWAS